MSEECAKGISLRTQMQLTKGRADFGCPCLFFKESIPDAHREILGLGTERSPFSRWIGLVGRLMFLWSLWTFRSAQTLQWHQIRSGQPKENLEAEAKAAYYSYDFEMDFGLQLN